MSYLFSLRCFWKLHHWTTLYRVDESWSTVPFIYRYDCVSKRGSRETAKRFSGSLWLVYCFTSRMTRPHRRAAVVIGALWRLIAGAGDRARSQWRHPLIPYHRYIRPYRSPTRKPRPAVVLINTLKALHSIVVELQVYISGHSNISSILYRCFERKYKDRGWNEHETINCCTHLIHWNNCRIFSKTKIKRSSRVLNLFELSGRMRNVF